MHKNEIKKNYEHYSKKYNRYFEDREISSPLEYLGASIQYNGSQLLTLEQFSYIMNFILNIMLQKIEARSIDSKMLIINAYDVKMEISFPDGIYFKQDKSRPILTLEKQGPLIRRLEYGSIHQNYILISINKMKLVFEGFLTFEKSFQAFFVQLDDPWNDYRSYYNSPIAGSLLFEISNNSFKTTLLSPLPLEDMEFPFPPVQSRLLKLSNNKLEMYEDYSSRILSIIKLCTRLSNAIINHVNSIPYLKDKRKVLKNAAYETTIYARINYFLQSLFHSISDKHHGSILIFGYKDKELKHISPGYIQMNIPFGRYFRELSQDFNKIMTMDEEKAEFDPLFLKLMTTINTIIGLSLLDGAIIFDDHMDVIAAGAILDVNVKDVDLEKGARHKSGKAFAEKTNTFAVVISQDGPISFYP